MDAVGDLVAEVVRIRAVEGHIVKSWPPDCPGAVFGNGVMAGHWISGPQTFQRGPMARRERLKRWLRRRIVSAPLSCRSGNASTRGSGVDGDGEDWPVRLMTDNVFGGAVLIRRSPSRR